MSESRLPETALPKCGKCGTKISKGTYEPIISNEYKQKGVRIVYECHGEAETYDLLTDFFTGELNGGQVCYLPVVFEVPFVPVKELNPGEAIAAMTVDRLRGNKLQARQFIESIIKDVVAEQSSFKADVTAWCADHNLRLEMAYASVLDHSCDVFQLVINTKTVLGQFQMPFHPDESDVKWIPTAKK